MESNDLKIIVTGAADEYREEIKSLQNYFHKWLISNKDKQSSQSDLDYIACNICQNCIIVSFLDSIESFLVKETIESLYTQRTNYKSIPYVILLSNELDADTKIDNYLSTILIDSEAKCDRRDIVFINSNKPKDKLLSSLFTLILKRYSYYHQLGKVFTIKPDLEHLISKHPILSELINSSDSINYHLKEYSLFKETINIMVVGSPGSGKSFLINQYLNEKRCGEGQGLQITNKITAYCHGKYPIQFIDTPDFDETLFKDYLDTKSKQIPIHVVLHLTNSNSRTMSLQDIKMVELFTQHSIPIYFIMTKGDNILRLKDFRALFISRLREITKDKIPIDSRVFYIRSVETQFNVKLEYHHDVLLSIYNMINNTYNQKIKHDLTNNQIDQAHGKENIIQFARAALYGGILYKQNKNSCKSSIIKLIMVSSSLYLFVWLLFEKLIPQKIKVYCSYTKFALFIIGFNKWIITKIDSNSCSIRDEKIISQQVINQFSDFILT